MLKCVEAEIANYEACLKEEVEKRKKFKVCLLRVCLRCWFGSLKASVWGVFMSKWTQLRMVLGSIRGPFPVTERPYGAELPPGQAEAPGAAAAASLRKKVERCSWATAGHRR